MNLGKRSFTDYIGELLRMLTDTGQDSSEIVRDDPVTNPLTEEPDELYDRSPRSIQYIGSCSDMTGIPKYSRR